MGFAQGDDRLAGARRLVAVGDAHGAIALLRQILALSPNHVEALRLYAAACRSARRRGEAERALRRAASAAPDHPQILCDTASLLDEEGRHEEADALLLRAVSLAPRDARALGARAEHLLSTHRVDEAEALLSPLMRNDPDARLATLWARLCRRRGRPGEGVRALAPAAHDPRLTPPMRAIVLHLLANLLDDCGRYDEAFAVATRANEVRSARFNEEAHNASVDLLIERWSLEAIDRLPVGDPGTERPVFIVGMPRSGTSLVEQVLASHPDVHGADERPEITMIVERLGGAQVRTDTPHMHRLEAMTPEMVSRAAGAYLDTMRALDATCARVTDKRPDNFLHLGLISRLFPRARVIHTRRHPLDTAVSCFFRDFAGPYPWSDTLEGIASYYEAYERLMDHWIGALDLDILQIRYEDIVNAPGIESHRLVHFLGLPWNEACLSFHESARVVRTASAEQVRRPVHPHAVGRWRNYERWLGPLIERLGGASDDAGTRVA